MWTCENGHDGQPDSSRFCGQCGAERPSPPSTEPAAAEAEAAPEPTPPRSSRRWLFVAGGVVAVVLLAVVLVTQLGGGADAVTIRGSMTLFDVGGVEGDPDDCGGTGGYDDFGAGMNVTVRSSDDEIIGSGDTRNAPVDEQLEYLVAAGEIEEGDEEARDLLENTANSVCVVLFDVEADEADFYAITVGSRGELSFSAEELADQDFAVALTLGSTEL